MSDTPADAPAAPQPAPQPTSQPPAAPLDLAPFAVKGAAPALDGSLRQALLTVGVQAGTLMLRAGTNPDDVAKATGIDINLLLNIMTGREPDVGVRALAALAKHLGGSLMVQMMPPPQPAPAAGS